MLNKILTRQSAVIITAAVTLWKLFLCATLQLHPDEAYYWLWSRFLAWGYYDHSPFIGYAIRLTTLFSQSELAVRFSGIIGSVVMSVLIWKLAMQMFDREDVAAASTIVLNILPLTITGSIIMTPDAPAFLFWALAVYFAWQVFRTGKPGWWYALGGAFGLSLLSKYTVVLFLPSLFLFLIITGERRWLKTVHPWLALAAGSALFLPVVWWNAAHDWISFRFQFAHGLGNDSYTLRWIGEYIGGQMLIIGPLLWGAGMYAAASVFFRKNRAMLFLSCLTVPIILFFAYSSLKRPAGPNWPAFAYFTFSILVSAWLLEEGSRAKRRLWAASCLITAFLSLATTVHARFSVVPLARWSKDLAIADATNWFYGWRELGQEILKHPEVRYVLTPSHQISAEVSYYTKEKVFVYVDLKRTRPSQYNLWQFPAALKGAPALYVDVIEDPNPSSMYKDCFTDIGDISFSTVTRRGFPIRTYRSIQARGYAQ